MGDSTDGLPGPIDDKNPHLPDKLSEAYRSFHVIPTSYRLAYLLHLLCMKPHLIAPIQGSDEETVKEQLAETEAILQHHLQAMEPEQIESMMRCLLEIDASSPPPLNELAGLVAEAKSLRSFVVDYDEMLESETVPLRTAPEMTHAECTEADRVLFNLPLSIREVFALHHFAGLDEREIANVLRISDSDVKQCLFLGRAIMSQLMEGLVVGMLQWKAATPEERRSEKIRMSKTERSTARSTWRLLPKECRSLVRWHLFHGLSVQEIAEKTGLDAEFVDDMIEFTREQLVLRMETLVTAWLRSNLPPGAAAETILQKLQADSFIEEESVPAPKRALSIGEAEISAAETTLYEMKALERRVFELFAVKCDLGKIASFLEMGPEEVRKNLRSARQQLADRFERLVTALLQRRMRLPHAPKLDGEETAAAKAVFKTIPKSCQKPYVLFMATGFSVEEIAETLGLLPYQVRERISKAKKTIRIRAIQAADAWVRQGEAIETARKRVIGFHKMISLLREIPEISEREAPATVPEPDFSYITAELDEIEAVIGRLDFEILEAFILNLGAGLNPAEIASVQKTDEKETIRRLTAGIETIRDEVERLVVAWLRKRMKYPNAPRLKPTEGLAAKQLFMSIPEKYREIFVRFHVKGESVEEIAAAFRADVGKVEHRLKRAERAMLDRAMQLAAQAVSERDASATVQSTKRQRVTKETSKKQRRNPVKTILASVGLLFSQLGAASPSTGKVAAGIAVPALATLAAPFLWVMSLLISGQVYGLAFVRTAPTLQARQWLVKQLFWCYSSLFISPFLFYPLFWFFWTLRGLHIGAKLNLIVLIACVCCNVIIFSRTFRAYHKYDKVKSFDIGTKINYTQISRTIRYGFILDSLIILLPLGLFFHGSVVPRFDGPESLTAIAHFLIIAGGICFIHFASYSAFCYFTSISKDEKAFQNTPPLSDEFKEKKTWIVELIRIIPFAAFPLLTNLTHVIFVREHALRTSVELIVYTTCWTIIWYIDTQIIKRRWLKRVVCFGSLAAQVLVMKLLRDFFS